MKIQRIYHNLETYLKPNKVLVLYGPRQVGKTTLLQDFLKSTSLKYRLESGDNLSVQHVFNSQNFDLIKEFAQNYELIAIDEAQKIESIGQGLKILVDQVPHIKIIATGSSSFELAGQIGEPLTGRKTTLTLYPLSQIELQNLYNPNELKHKLEDLLIFGSYPEIITTQNKTEKRKLLLELVNSYLLKDILALDKVKNSKTLLDLIRLLAFQVGQEVSLSELGSQLGIDYKTVGRYIDLLEKSFVIYPLQGFSRNLRKEIAKKSKYYFYDVGVRNAIISNFNPLALRNDKDSLWENFLLMERLKKQAYHNLFANNYFWRTWDQKEIDFIEERDGRLFGFEFKWTPQKVSPPQDWLTAYPQSQFKTIHTQNYLNFVT